ncbi:hypothetical protein LP419_18205 [Massilia sp. H-1]|nr:hypothetical protein LP419_18205 [Massilia sp. H-1]
MSGVRKQLARGTAAVELALILSATVVLMPSRGAVCQGVLPVQRNEGSDPGRRRLPGQPARRLRSRTTPSGRAPSSSPSAWCTTPPHGCQHERHHQRGTGLRRVRQPFLQPARCRTCLA